MHLEVRVLTQVLDLHERIARPVRETIFGATIGALAPQARDQLTQLRFRRAVAQRAAQIGSGLGVQRLGTSGVIGVSRCKGRFTDE